MTPSTPQLRDNPHAARYVMRSRARAREPRSMPQPEHELVRCDSCGSLYDPIESVCRCNDKP